MLSSIAISASDTCPKVRRSHAKSFSARANLNLMYVSWRGDALLRHCLQFATLSLSASALARMNCNASAGCSCSTCSLKLDMRRALLNKNADALKESVANWRQCLKSASPLQETYVKFKLARALNDFACDLRTLGQVSEAEIAIEESIQIKRASGALPHSLAISLSEYSQILTVQGKIRQAQPINEEGVKILEHAIENGDTSHNPELGMLLGERANIFWQQARFTEAKPLLERAVELIGDKPSRQKDKNKAIAQLKEIELITSSSRLYQFDQLWFPRFSDLVDYDDLDMLTQAGPFTEQEQAEWDRLSSQEKDDRTKKALQELMAQSRKREFSRSLEENRTPILRYPCIPLHDVQDRISGLTSLHNEIETQETNAVVRRLYLDAIDEHLMVLHLCEATILQNQEMVKYCILNSRRLGLSYNFKLQYFTISWFCNIVASQRCKTIKCSSMASRYRRRTTAFVSCVSISLCREVKPLMRS